MPNKETIGQRQARQTKNRQTGWVESANDPNVLTQGPKPVLGSYYTYKVNKTTGAIDVYRSGNAITGDFQVMNISGSTGSVTSFGGATGLSKEILTNLKANAIKDSRVAMQNNASPETLQNLKNSPVYKGVDTKKAQQDSSTLTDSGGSKTGADPKSGTGDGNPNSKSGESVQEKSPEQLEQEYGYVGKRSDKGWIKYLAYPENHSGDKIKIDVVEYRKSGLQSPEGGFGFIQQSQRETKILSSIYLPIQSGISDSMSVDWGSGELNPITAKFAGLAMGTIAAGAEGPGAAFGAFSSGLKDVASAFLSKENSPELRQMMVNYFTQEAVGMQGLLSRTAGAAINNNLELLFQGPQLRSFTFTFRLTPRNDKEATTIKQIIRTFKTSMVPEATSSNLFLLAPNVFNVSYLISAKGPDGKGTLQLHPYLNKLKRCALKDFSVSYTPDNQYMTYQDGSMTAYELNMTFAEIDPVLANDYKNISDVSEGMGY